MPHKPLPKVYVLPTTLIALLLAGAASAHATVVFGTLTSEPSPPQPGEPLELHLELVGPSSVPVEDAFVVAEFRLQGEEMGSVRLPETDVAGLYRADLQLEEAGEYQVTLRDQTYRQEEAVSEVQLPVGTTEPLEPIEFIFPPTAVGGSLTTWLIWLIGVPLVAGLVVTLLVLKSGPDNRDGSKERE